MAIDTTVSSWAVDQFGELAQQVAVGVVQALAEAQRVGTRTQSASGLRPRYSYGSTWISKFQQLEAHLGGLPGVETVAVPNTGYSIVVVNGRRLIPFVLAKSLGEVPDRPKLPNAALRAFVSKIVPPPPSPASLFDDVDLPGQVPWSMPRPRSASDDVASTRKSTPVEALPVFIGTVCNAESESLLALWWGTATSIDSDGMMLWSPEQLPLRFVDATPLLRSVPGLTDGDRRLSAFDEGDVPNVQMAARPRPRPVDTPPVPDDVPRGEDPAGTEHE